MIVLVRDAIASEKIVLGVCLGAQIIAKALGAKVYKGAQKEIGWVPVRAETAHALFDGLPGQFMAFHWHGGHPSPGKGRAACFDAGNGKPSVRGWEKGLLACSSTWRPQKKA